MLFSSSRINTQALRPYVALLACVGLFPAVVSAADPIKLNGPLVAGGDLLFQQFSPDSSRVLYQADQDTDNVYEIFSVPSAGGASTKLNGPLVAFGDVSSSGLQFSPDSSRVLYQADQDTDSVDEIFSVPSAGGASTKLNGPLVVSGNVSSSGLQFSPDSSRVLYRADQDTNAVYEIYSVPSAGGASTKLNGPLVAGGAVYSDGLQFSPDSSRVLYLADQDTTYVLEIFSVPSAGGAATKLNGPLVAGGDVYSGGLQFSPDSSRVLYLADQDTDNVNEIFSVPSAGGASTKLNGPLVAGGGVYNNGLQFSPDSSRVLYRADQDTDNVTEIYIVPATGGTPVKLNGPLVAGGDLLFQQFSPDSSRVLYQADQDTDNVYEIFSVPSVGGAATKLNGPLVAGGDVSSSGLQFSPDSSRVLYQADQDTNAVYEIYSVPSAGGASTKLNGPLVAGGDVFSNGMQFSPDSSRVLYLADQDTDAVNEIYIVPATGGTPVKLNGPLVAGGDVSSGGLQFSPDSSRVLYRADQDTDSVDEAYVRIVRDRANTGGGDWDTVATWDQAVLPDNVMQTFIDTPGTVTATGNTTARTVNELIVGGGTGISILALDSGAFITAINGVRIASGGVLRGNGHIATDLTIESGGEIRAAAAEHLLIGGLNLANAGRIEAIGTAFDLAEIEFYGVVTNSTGTGSIVASNAILRFDGGLTNDSAVALSFGTTYVLGDVTNSNTGTIAIAGNSGATFYDDVTNGGTLNVAGGSTAVFFGALAGNGNIGSGDIQALGDLLPGASPGTMTFGGDLTLGPLTNLEIELSGLTAGSQFDQLVIAGDATLAGTLNVSLIDGFTLAAGQQFEILNVGGSLVGAFAGLAEGDLFGNFGGTNLLITYAGGDGNDVTLLTALPGDFDIDGDVDGFDFLTWQRGGSPTPLSSGDLSDWQTNYGTVAPLSAASAVVPEPSALLLGLMASLAGISRRRRR